MEFEPILTSEETQHNPVSQIYLVEFELSWLRLNVVSPTLSPKSTLWNLNEVVLDYEAYNEIPSQIYLVEFERGDVNDDAKVIVESQIYLVEFERNENITPELLHNTPL